jgi:hypothetical protein
LNISLLHKRNKENWQKLTKSGFFKILYINQSHQQARSIKQEKLNFSKDSDLCGFLIMYRCPYAGCPAQQ